jgi:hypothetical protein
MPAPPIPILHTAPPPKSYKDIFEVIARNVDYFIVQKNPPGYAASGTAGACVYHAALPDGTIARCGIGCCFDLPNGGPLKGLIAKVSFLMGGPETPVGELFHKAFRGIPHAHLAAVQDAHDRAANDASDATGIDPVRFRSYYKAALTALKEAFAAAYSPVIIV